MHRRIALIAAGLIAALAANLPAQTNIRPSPSGERLLFVDGQNIRREPGGNRLLFIDGDNIRPDPGGPRILFVDGPNVRPDPHGIRLAFLDGKQIRRNPGSKPLLFVDHPNIRPDAHGDRMFFIDGPPLTKQQLVAVLHLLKPELFKLSPSEEAELKKAMAEAEAESEKKPEETSSATYTIAQFSSSDGQKRSGKVTLDKRGNLYAMTFKFADADEWQGVGFHNGNELWVAAGPAKTVGLVIYTIQGGNLDGSWYPFYAPGTDEKNIGKEKITGSAQLNGTYKITMGRSPNSGDPYAGTVAIQPQKLKLDDGTPVLSLNWQMGTFKAAGVGLRLGNHLVASSGTGKEFSVVRFKVENGNLIGDFVSNTGAKGFYTLIKD